MAEKYFLPWSIRISLQYNNLKLGKSQFSRFDTHVDEKHQLTTSKLQTPAPANEYK